MALQPAFVDNPAGLLPFYPTTMTALVTAPKRTRLASFAAYTEAL